MYEVPMGMGELDAGGRKMTRGEIMSRMRSQVLLVRRLSEQMKELSRDGVRSLRLGGAPGGGCASERGLDVQLARKEALERMLERESARLREYEQDARREMGGMKPVLYSFCQLYYIDGCSIEETSALIDRSARQCERYKRTICGE